MNALPMTVKPSDLLDELAEVLGAGPLAAAMRARARIARRDTHTYNRRPSATTNQED